MTAFSESEIEDATLEWLEGLDWTIALRPDIAPDAPDAERADRASGRQHPRMANVPVTVPLSHAPYQGSIYENQRTLETRYFE